MARPDPLALNSNMIWYDSVQAEKSRALRKASQDAFNEAQQNPSEEEEDIEDDAASGKKSSSISETRF